MAKLRLRDRVKSLYTDDGEYNIFNPYQGLTWGASSPALHGYTQWHEVQHQAGRPVNVLGVNNAGPVFEIQESSISHPDDFLCWRDSLWTDGVNIDPNNPNFNNDPEAEAELRFAFKYDVKWPPELDKNRCWLKDENETRTKLADDGSESMWRNLTVGEWQGRYNLRFAQLAVENDRRVVLMSISSADHDEVYWNNPSMIECLAYAAEHREHVVIGLHEYSYVRENLFALMGNDDATWQQLLAAPTVDRKIGRFILLFDFCDSVGIDWPTIHCPEWGWAQGNIPLNPDHSMAQIKIFWEHVMGPYIEYFAGMGTWYSDDWYDHQGGVKLKYQVQDLFPNFAHMAVDTTYRVKARRPATGPVDPPPIDPDPVEFDNPCFSNGWTTLNGGNQEPHDWQLMWYETGSELPNGQIATGTPECVHKLEDQLPDNEKPGGPDALILCGDAVYKCFGRSRIWGASLLTQLNELIPSTRYKIVGHIQVHYHSDVNETDHNAVRLITFLEEKIWQTPSLPDREWVELSILGQSDVNGNLSVQIDMWNKYMTTEDYFIDDFTVVLDEEIPPVEPEPECRGEPRTQYRREYWYHEPIMDQETKDKLYAMASLAGVTVGPSADDAGIGDLDDKTAVGWDIPQGSHQEYVEWFNRYYAGTKTDFRFVGDEPPIDPPPIDPPEGLGFSSPVSPDVDGIWPGAWIDATLFGLFYSFANGTAYHEAADLNLNEPHWDADKLAPVYATEDGEVVWSGIGGGTWGNLIVIKHEHKGFGHIYSRYAHLDSRMVQTGELVIKGEQVGRIGDAFGQLAYHLHFGFAVTNILETNPQHWPGNSLSSVVENYIDPKHLLLLSAPGYEWPDRYTAWISRNVNFRCGPNSSYTVVRVVTSGTEVQVINKFDDYHLIFQNNQYGWVHEDFLALSPPQIPEGAHTKLGLHASANDGMGLHWELVRQEFLKLKPEVIKVQSFHDPAMIATLAAENKMTCKMFIVRAFLNWGGRHVTSQQFVNDTLNDTHRSVNALLGQGIDPANIYIELHNEMNLSQEGWGLSWNNGEECGAFFSYVVAEYKKIMPTVKYGIGGLSPGGEDPQRMESMNFATGLKDSGVYGLLDVNFTHVYTVGGWTGPYEVTEWIDWNIANMPLSDSIVITESSWHTPNRDIVSGQLYAAELNRLMTMLDARPVLGVTFFVSDASNPSFWHECWILHSKEDPYQDGYSRGIATEMRRLRPLP